jgi:hypothetical protein
VVEAVSEMRTQMEIGRAVGVGVAHADHQLAASAADFETTGQGIVV